MPLQLAQPMKASTADLLWKNIFITKTLIPFIENLCTDISWWWFYGNTHPPTLSATMCPPQISSEAVASFGVSQALAEDCISIFKRTDALTVSVRN